MSDSLDSSMPRFPVLYHLPEFIQIHVHWDSDAIQPSQLLLPLSPPSLTLSQHQGPFPWVDSLHQVAKVLEFQRQYQSFQWILMVDVFQDWLVRFLAVQGTLNSLLQYHILKASIVRCSAFFMVQLSHPFMTTAKTIVLTIWTLVGTVMILLFNTLSTFVLSFLPRSKHLLISWLQSTSTVISYKYCHEVVGPDAMIFIFWMLSFKPTFSLSSFTFFKSLFSSSSLSAIRVVSSAYLNYWCFSQQSWFWLKLNPAQHFAWCTLHIS